MPNKLLKILTLFALQKRHALGGIVISFTLYLLLFFNWNSCAYGELGGFMLTSPRVEALAAIAWSLLPFVWLTCLFILGPPWLKGISAAGFLAFGFIVFLTVMVESSAIGSDHDDMREIIADKQIDDRSNLVTYKVNPGAMSSYYRQEWMERKILPGIIWCKKLSSDRMD